MNATSHTRPRIRVSRDRVVGLVVALACLTFSVVGLRVNEPRRFEYVTGTRNQPVWLEQAQLTIGDVEVGTRLRRFSRVTAETSGMFVLVKASLAVPGRQAVRLDNTQLVTRTRTYDNWSGDALAAEPGFRQREVLVFEVDPSQIDDLTLEIWHEGIVNGYHQRARIHLGITAANSEQWRRAGQGRDLEITSSPAAEALR
ncbi:MAG: hypothetical protein QM650_15815 [Microlunatus sp.]